MARRRTTRASLACRARLGLHGGSYDLIATALSAFFFFFLFPRSSLGGTPPTTSSETMPCSTVTSRGGGVSPSRASRRQCDQSSPPVLSAQAHRCRSSSARPCPAAVYVIDTTYVCISACSSLSIRPFWRPPRRRAFWTDTYCPAHYSDAHRPFLSRARRASYGPSSLLSHFADRQEPLSSHLTSKDRRGEKGWGEGRDSFRDQTASHRFAFSFSLSPLVLPRGLRLVRR
ncbi:hypothetical protein GGS23DRAFT_248711 [Durotheca rogersii]|uniref:uncharacterized protein n=1 Tax=Durotheca rogersii TaxID=419775 RepID=UPI002220EC2B|nr:uncharacterized protein GGS23DRAFT_248711 [Durotheca rogersii]KAI5860093.1 hypothetical protein GGS23DRAFT_248711 [Durotheca rogersii]